VAVAALWLQIGVTDRAPPSDKILRVLLAHHPTHAEALGAKLGAAAQGPAVVFSGRRCYGQCEGVAAWAGGMGGWHVTGVTVQRRIVELCLDLELFREVRERVALSSARRRPHVAMSDSWTLVALPMSDSWTLVALPHCHVSCVPQAQRAIRRFGLEEVFAAAVARHSEAAVRRLVAKGKLQHAVGAAGSDVRLQQAAAIRTRRTHARTHA
jgi:hypothetical protein